MHNGLGYCANAAIKPSQTWRLSSPSHPCCAPLTRRWAPATLVVMVMRSWAQVTLLHHTESQPASSIVIQPLRQKSCNSLCNQLLHHSYLADSCHLCIVHFHGCLSMPHTPGVQRYACVHSVLHVTYTGNMPALAVTGEETRSSRLSAIKTEPP